MPGTSIHVDQHGYPDEVVDGAREAAERTARLIKDGAEPFGMAAERWLSQVDPESLRRLDNLP